MLKKKPTHLQLFLIILLIIQTKTANDPKFEQNNKTCLSSSGAKADQIAKIRLGKFSNEKEIQKYFGCMMKAAGVINDKGQLQVPVLKTKVPKDMKRDEAMKIFLSCKDKKGQNLDETSYLLYKCFWEASPRHLSLDGF